MECNCKQILNNTGVKVENIAVHYYGCPHSETYKEYQALSWWKKLFIRNPYKDYIRYNFPNS